MDPVEREIFRQLFASIAEEMGVTLMRSAFSPNIKERRDFSCALFDADGEMVAQAAHIPVHLGSTPLSVQAAIEDVEMGRDGHAVLNDPYRGGTHLPDITFVSPVCDDAGEVRFYVANRAHHADVGGRSPGSLPLSDSIDDEGIRIPPTRWSDELVERIASASRTPEERRGDLQAQLAANLRGRRRLEEQIERHGREAWRAADQLQSYSERFMRRTIEDMPSGTWAFRDVLDGDGFDSGSLELTCEVTLGDDHATVDWSETASQTRGPVNAPRAVTLSAVLYVFRCLAPDEMPSNGGYMRCIDVETESGTLVDAEPPAPVAVGNVETSQRITDVVLGALAEPLPGRIPAASCGSMNNVTIGVDDPRGDGAENFTYYETIAGGSGGHASGEGTDAIHTHMTNTLNTPIEALEHAYPLRVERYAIRDDSGGDAPHAGGDGVVRSYVFDGDATATLMTERREHPPYGLQGGNPGQRGHNILVRDGEPKALPGKCVVELGEGDRLRIETPGGGGWGRETTSSPEFRNSED